MTPGISAQIITREIRATILGARGEGAGDLARAALIAEGVPGAADMTDAEALAALINDIVVDGKADKDVAITGGGLATGGGTLEDDRVISVAKANLSTARVGTDDTVAVTPATAAVNRVMPLTNVATTDGITYTADCALLPSAVPNAGDVFSLLIGTNNADPGADEILLAINGDTPRVVRDMLGNKLTPGQLRASGRYFVLRTSGSFGYRVMALNSVASSAEATAGTDNVKTMTAARVAQVVGAEATARTAADSAEQAARISGDSALSTAKADKTQVIAAGDGITTAGDFGSGPSVAVDYPAVKEEIGVHNDLGELSPLDPSFLPTGVNVVGAITDDPTGGALTPFLAMLDDGSIGATTLRIWDLLSLGKGDMAVQVVVEEHNYQFAVCDAETGTVVVGLLDGVWYGPAGTAGAVADPLARDARNQDYAQTVRGREITHVAAFDHALNVDFDAGQSNAEGAQTWPALSKVNFDGNLMFGAFVWSTTDPGFTPLTSAAFYPLVANVSNGSSNGILSDAAVAALATSALNRGETMGVGRANLFKRLANRRKGTEADPSRLVVLNSVARGGRSIDELKKGHTLGPDEWYDRFIQAMQGIKTLAVAGGKSAQLMGYNWVQGESEYLGTGESLDRTDYKTRLIAHWSDVSADAATYLGNTLPPYIGVAVPGQDFTRDLDIAGNPDLFVAMAIKAAVRETANAWIWGPFYAYTDKGGHLDSNGALWSGLKAALVQDRVINRGLDWEPLDLLASEISGKVIHLHYAVPEPPLQFMPAYRYSGDPAVVDPGVMFDDRGYRVRDIADPEYGADGQLTGGTVLGDIAIESVEIAAPTIVRITLARAPYGTAFVTYADYEGYYAETGVRHNGGGNLCDSERTHPLAVYQYLAGTGMFAASNIPALVGLPFLTCNWALPDFSPATWERF